MATKTRATEVFAGLRCPHCGEAEGLAVKLESLAIECGQCGEETDRSEIEAMIAKWSRLFDWIDSAASFAAPK